MTLPVKAKTWTLSTNNRIPFVSLNDTMANYLLGVKNFLKAHGYTVKGSCNGVTGAMDAVDRWITAANVNTRFNGAGGAQSWVVLTDGNACDILLTYQGASDDVARVSYSITGVFVAAGTPANQPTATDEAVISSVGSFINATASGDRIWNGWVDSTSKLCRFGLFRGGIMAGRLWGVELVSSVVTGAIVTWANPVWGFAMDVTTTSFFSGTVSGVVRAIVSSVSTTVNQVFGIEWVANGGLAAFSANKNEMQGATGYPAVPVAIGSSVAGAVGKYGNLIDFWTGRAAGGLSGDLYGTLTNQFIALLPGLNASLLWPWDGVSIPVTS